MTPVPATHCPTPRELADLELLLSGALAPRRAFDPDGGFSLALADDVRANLLAGEALTLTDPEGFPVATLTTEGLRALGRPAYGAFRRLYRMPAEVRADHPGALTVLVDRALTSADLDRIADARQGAEVVLLALTGPGTPIALSGVGLIRCTLAAAEMIGHATVVAVPLATHGDSSLDDELRAAVRANYAPGAVLDLPPQGRPDDALPAPIAEAARRDRPDPPGLVVLFTGFSGSGKSTIAQALTDVILESGRRTVTSLDGDVVRRELSAGLGFSPADRETNIARIGWVAAEIARHGGIAICSPIAPFDRTRQHVRRLVADAGAEFRLVHIATPIEECERRDRKGLYAKARAGEIPDFTGISSPYEVPTDVDLRVDTTGRSVGEVLAEVLSILPADVS